MGVIGTAWLVDAVSGAPSYTGRLNRQNTSVFLAGATTARPFGAFSGVRPGTSAVTVTATSTTWTAQTFAGCIDGEASALAGPYNFAFNLVTSGAVTVSNASNPRIDTLAVQISDPAEADGTSIPLVTLVYTAGVAAASPTVPATPARSFIVALLTFPAGAGTTPTVTWVAPYTVAAGGAGEVNTFTQLGVYSYLTAPRAGTVVRAMDTGVIYRYTGTAWKADPRTDVSTSVVLVGTIWDGVSQLIEKRSTVTVTIVSGSTLIANWEGGSFPNGVLACTVVSAGAGAGYTGTQAILANLTLSQLQVQLLTNVGGGVANSSVQRVSYYATGW